MANDFQGFNAEVWAQEALETLEETIGVSQGFNRDFETDMAEFGDTIHARRLGTFVGDRLEEGGTLNVQNAVSVEQLIKLNQHVTVAFPITDRELRRSFRDLRNDFIAPAVRGVIEAIDLICIGQQYQSYKNQAGQLNSALTYKDTVQLSKIMSANLNTRDNRMLWVGTSGEADLLNTDKLTEARMTGDGSPILNGQIGRASGFDVGMTQMAVERGAGHVIDDGQVNLAAGYPAGTTAIVVNNFTSAILSGTFLDIDGQVHRLVSSAGGPPPTSIVIEAPGLHAAVADDAVIKAYTSAAVTDDYALDYSDWIVIDGAAMDAAAEFPIIGEGIAFGTAPEVYGIYQSDFANLRFKLNRPLDAAVADNATVNVFPAGAYNFAFRPGMSTILVKSMPAPPPETGVLSAVVTIDGWAMRTMLSYDRKTFKYTYSLDCLVGVKTTDAAQGALLLGVL